MGAIAGVVLVVVLAAATPAYGKCQVETPGPSPAPGAKRLAELEANSSRPSLTLALGGKRSDSDDVTLATIRKARVGAKPEDVTADVRDSLRKADDKLEGTVVVLATPRRGQDTIAVDLCVDRAKRWQAGKYEGTVTVDGPRLSQFSYPIVVTKKWPWWAALILLAAILIGYVVYAAATSNQGITGRGAKWARTIYLAVSVAGGLLAYWSVYGKNETWGENPGADILALALAGLTGAIAGGTAARTWFNKITKANGGHHQIGGGARGGEGRV